eukprot:7069775-Karenia_brevis.AAC.1
MAARWPHDSRTIADVAVVAFRSKRNTTKTSGYHAAIVRQSCGHVRLSCGQCGRPTPTPHQGCWLVVVVSF